MQDIGILPLTLLLPFFYFPQVLSSDTQPWVLIGALIAFLSFRVATPIPSRDILLFAVAIICAAVSFLRSPIDVDLARSTFNFMAFILTWSVVRRAGDDYLASGVRLTIIIWFIVGLFEYITVQIGSPIVLIGRFDANYSGGVPSLTAEASFYGTMSIVQVVYLLGRKESKNHLYILLGCISVLLSGSALSILLLVFPFVWMPRRMKALAIVLVALIFTFNSLTRSSDGPSRLASIAQPGGAALDFLVDSSVNLRAGHIWFTLIDNLPNSLILRGRVGFMNDYNDFADRTGILIATESNLILPSGGEIIYRSGPFGVLLLGLLAAETVRGARTTGRKIQRLAVFFACMINPVQIANIFFIMFVQNDEGA